jgi:multimeric flavodoxin WrbA
MTETSNKKVLGIIASPRRLGNCEIFTKEISRHIPESHELNLLRLSDFNIKSCKGCYLCLYKKERCIQKDDLHTVLDAIANADALILTVPSYFLGPNSSLKRLLDRGMAFYALADRLWRKPAVGVGIAGIQGKEGYTLLGIESFLKFLLSDIKYCAMVYGALPGEVFMNERNNRTAAMLGKALFNPSTESRHPSCPLCGGHTFRFLQDGIIRCMLCSHTGTFSVKDGEPVFQITKDNHGLFLSKEDALKHREWLREEVRKYSQQKDDLKKIQQQYRDEGNWIKPPNKQDIRGKGGV